MGRDHLGKPTDTSKEDQTGLRRDQPADITGKDKDAAEKFTDENGNISGDIHVRHPNRNPDKEDSTNAGGYKQ